MPSFPIYDSRSRDTFYFTLTPEYEFSGFSWRADTARFDAENVPINKMKIPHHIFAKAEAERKSMKRNLKRKLLDAAAQRD